MIVLLWQLKGGGMKTQISWHPVVLATIVVKMIKACLERMYCSFSPLKVNSVSKDRENWF